MMSELEKAVLAALTKNHNDGYPDRNGFTRKAGWTLVNRQCFRD